MTGYILRMLRRSWPEWVMDLSGLLVQAVAVPSLGVLAGGALRSAFPSWAGALALPAVLSFALNFAGVDYLYYWNHRLLHGKLWRWHAAHHSARSMDVLITSRNTLWTPALIVYVWANAFFVFVLADPRPYLLGVALSSLLDVWRHSDMPSPGGILARVLVTPRDHAWHHSSTRHDSNYAANMKLWDRLHGTSFEPGQDPETFGVHLEGGLLRRLVIP